MNRIDALFLRKQRDILSIYFCAGYPTLDTIDTIKALSEAGIDLVEVGIPYSDPTADGPVIQRASEQALANKMSLRLLFEQLADVRKYTDIPLVLMGYFGPVMRFGFERFCEKCVEVGIDGVILPDMPLVEYEREYRAIAERHGVHIIMLITPETSDERMRYIDSITNGFIYMVSSASTTGAKDDFSPEQQAYFNRVNALNLRNPRMIGFGISNARTLQKAHAAASGAIIGSKFVQLQGEHPTAQEAVNALLHALQA